jgi:hypothetical protein
MKFLILFFIILFSQFSMASELKVGDRIASNCTYLSGKLNFSGVEKNQLMSLVLTEMPSKNTGGFAILEMINETTKEQLRYSIDSNLMLRDDSTMVIYMNDNADPEPSHYITADLSKKVLTITYEGGYNPGLEYGSSVKFKCESFIAINQ